MLNLDTERYNKIMSRINSRKDRIILAELTKTDFKLRYQNSVLGYLWAIIRPMLMFGILYVVFAKFLRFGDSIPHYPVYLLTGTATSISPSTLFFRMRLIASPVTSSAMMRRLFPSSAAAIIASRISRELSSLKSVIRIYGS